MAKKAYVRNSENTEWIEIASATTDLSAYLTNSSASNTYLTQISASSTYATKTELNNIDLSSASTAAVAAIVDSAPATLNTLNELAAALGDDANYASTITSALGTKSPIVNPVFTNDIQVDGQINLAMSGSVATSYISSFNDLFAGGPSTKLLGRYVQVETDVVEDQFARLSLQPGIAALTSTGNLLVSGDTGTYINSVDPDNQIATIGNITGFRNLLINGDMRINQREVTSGTADGTFCFDRWKMNNSGGTCTYSAQTFTLGNAISGYEPTNHARIVTSGQSTSGHFAMLRQNIEDVRTFAGQTITVSFWAKAASGTPKVALELEQNFGSGGSPSSAVTTYAGQVTLSTSWARYSLTVTMPSISGKTIGTTANTSHVLCSLFVSAGSDWNARTGTLGIQSNTFDFWGVQAEKGTIATPFEQRPIGTELSLCQRYYYRSVASGSYTYFATGSAQNNSTIFATTSLPMSMRTSPTSIDIPALANFWVENGTASTTSLTGVTLQTTICNPNTLGLSITSSSAFTAGLFYRFLANNTTNAYIGVNAEL